MEVSEIKYVPSKNKKVDLESLQNKTQDELVEIIRQLQAHNEQLKAIIAKNCREEKQDKDHGKVNDFDFSRCKWAHILLKLVYFGWDYQGYVCQDDTSETIEHHLIQALLKCRLIKSRETSNYHRCGRTDKGVSSFSQVISITVRAADEGKKTLDYCKMLNRLLPDDIKVICWQPIAEEFSARFNCKSRTYRYFFPKGDLDIEAMQEGTRHLLGTHDFRNLCKMDVGNGVTNFLRTIDRATVSKLEDHHDDGYDIYFFELQSQAFLWHQVRCIVAVLLLIGRKLEKPSVFYDLLNIGENPRKPQYPMAHPIGLNLFLTEFECGNWILDEEEIIRVIETLQKHWTLNAIKTTHIKSSILELTKLVSKNIKVQDSVLLRQESKIYKPLLARNKCSTLEEKICHFVKRRRIKENVE
ncbi:tRNA pseudouridine(38/39) synthase [Halyomorpha halys]|uniref:tRNA pseudouridine(38/39) synthase n=1 Tax=Halyomorpha halys TaxID=286706 RepID=UPI0006D4C76F|nr:tRNA pseudouridine(38/39) synthase [Halyomorpha halys]